nr:hypothetical protein DA06_27030 [Georgenia sp. SUBG003]
MAPTSTTDATVGSESTLSSTSATTKEPARIPQGAHAGNLPVRSSSGAVVVVISSLPRTRRGGR